MNRRATAAILIGAMVVAPVTAGATTIHTGGSTGLLLLAQKLANAYHAAKGVTVTVTGGGSGAGVKGAASGKYDIGDSSRAPKAGDAAGLYFTAIDREPFLVIVNPKNPIKSLTKAQIKGIFTGKITNWKSVGWSHGGTIKVYSRISTSGTLATFIKLFLGGQSVTASAPALASNGLDRSSVAGNKSGISFVTFQYSVGTSVIRPLKVSNIAGTLRNVINGSYKYWGFQYFVTKGAPKGAVKAYVTWVRGSSKARSVMGPYAIPAPSGPVIVTH
jgi:phosphate transport system substrate-binding protein